MIRFLGISDILALFKALRFCLQLQIQEKKTVMQEYYQETKKPVAKDFLNNLKYNGANRNN